MDTDADEGRSPYRTRLEVESLVREFEDCTLPLSRFKHPAHLAVALLYLSRMEAPEATARMRESLQRLIAHYGVAGYNETITLFWVRLAHAFLSRTRGRSFIETLDELIERYGDPHLIFDYYTRELLMSSEAKARWVEPDLKPLDF